MRYLLFILALPLLAQAQTKEQQCSRLQTMASALEKKIQTKFSPACEEIPQSKSKDLEKQDYRCKDLASVEAQLKTIENEIAMYRGVNSLRDETIGAKETLDNTKNKAASSDSSHLFYQNLKIAATIEGFLNTKGIKNENLLTELAETKNDDDLKDVEKFQALIESSCIKIGVNKGASVVCDNPKNFSLDEMKEVNGLLLLARKTKRKFDDSQIKDLKNALAIRDGEKEYSFTQLLSEITAPNANESFSEKDLAKIASHKISPQGEKYSFLKAMDTQAKTLAETKALRSAQALPARFETFFSNLKSREEYELKAKLSVILNELKNDIPESAKAACAEARTLTGQVDTCLEALSQNLPISSTQRSSATDILYELKAGLRQIKKLEQLKIDCAPVTEDMSLLASCSQYLDQGLEELQGKAAELSAIRNKILEGSEQLLAARDLALHTIVLKECMSSTEIQLQCDADLGNISREAIALSDSAGEIIMVLDKPAATPDLAALCKATPQESNHVEEICKYALMSEAEPVKAKGPASPFQAPVEAEPNRNVAGQAWADLLGNLGQAAGNFLAPRQQMTNPYASIFPSTNMMGQPRDIKNQIMDPYMVTGFGGYAPTAGLKPYSSINSNVGVSSAYSFGASSYFNSPVGW